MLSSYKTKSLLTNYSFVLPALILFAIFNIYPFLLIFKLSVSQWDGITPQMKFVGLAHFKQLILHDNIWWQSIWHGLYLTLLALIIQNVFALILALIVDKGIKAGQIYRVIFFLPPVLSFIVVGLIWYWIYDGNYGLLNYFLNLIGMGHLKQVWLANPKTALTCVGVVNMWKGFGWGFIILLAGLQSIPRDLYEAARVDGASKYQIFWHITVPLMIPVFVLVSILTILGTMQIFDLIIALTGGGPANHTEVPITQMVNRYLFGRNVYGYACAAGLIFGFILLIVSILQILVSKRVKQE